MLTSCRSIRKKAATYTAVVASLLICSLQNVQGFFITNRFELITFTVAEEQPVGTVIITVKTDQPADVFEMTGNAGGYLDINSTTGEIFIKNRIDREALASNSLTATVTARKGSTTVSVDLRCIVQDINDVTPSFPERLYEASISEKTAIGNLVYTVKAIDPESGSFGQQSVTYEITGGNEDGSFSVTQYGGQVKVSRELDYETKTQYTLNITAKDNPGLRNWTILQVNVVDADDLPAKFTAFVYTAEVSEAASVGTSIFQVVAFDLDRAINDNVTYGIDQVTNPSRLFAINNLTGLISLNGTLDRESVADYSIRVLAYSSYPVTDHAMVNIKVVDVNDNRPVFTQSVYQGTVVENVAAGTSVVKVDATDKDQGINAELRYHIKIGTDSSRFFINNKTGVVTTAIQLDREEKNLYNLTVVVEDMGANNTMGNVLNNTATVHIHVQDANDNAPVFTSSSYNVTLNESIPVGAKVVQVEAKDPDVNQDIIYDITGGNDLSRFLIGRTSGTVYVRSGIDRDPPRNETAFTLKVMALDDKNHLLNSTTSVTVAVNDVNDNQPHCSQDRYSASVYENATDGTVVMSLSCSDIDMGDNARLQYQLVSGADSKFNIHLASGEVHTIGALDYDNGNTSYQLSLLVTDHGNLPLSRTIFLDIEVININDNYPVFKKSQYNFSVLEGDYSSLAVMIGKVEASDDDADAQGCPCGEIRYSILNSSVPGIFSIDHVTGVVSTSSVLDREAQPTYILVVMATDQDPWKPLSNTTIVTILVADQNDNSPIFDQVNYTAKVAEDAGLGHQVIKVSSSDRDTGRNANISYSIVTGNTGGVFAINEMTGQIRTIAQLDYEAIKKYDLTVAAIDGGVSPRRTTVSVTVDVIDTNDNKPVCVNNGMTAKIRENLPPGQFVTKISVRDEDHDINQRTHFRLESDSFAVNNMTGDVSTTRSLDRENQSNYSLTIEVYNYNQSCMSVNCTVMVEVEDDNDNSPVFNSSSLSISVSEGAVVGSSLLRVTATDKDEAYNSDIRYALIGDGTWFAVNDTTGIITLISSLDREATPHYTLQIVARDRGLPQARSSIFYLSINVTDVNDNTPVFDKAIYLGSVPENAVNSTVITVSARDKDEGLNSQIDYLITGGDVGNAFSISSNGTITTAAPLDRETRDRYELNITARDRERPSLESTARAVITVKDVNDNAPNITNAPPQITVQENTPTGSLIYLLTADDKDLGLNTRVTFTGHAEPAGTFVLNPETGMITTVGTLDRETVQRYTFLAFATDHGTPSLNSSTVSFDIIISDLNDNNPVFNPVSYAVNISEDVAITTVIVRVNASDKDWGESGKIAYRIEAGDAQGYLTIDNTTGVIRSSKTLDRESISRFDLMISAKDHGSPARYGYGYVIIFITDTNDLPPVFTLSQYSASIKENIVIGTPVTMVTATDGDIGPNAKITYSIVDGESMADFNITTIEEFDPGSQKRRFIGRIYSARDLDRETRVSYNLTVLASDGVHNSTTQVVITLQDENDSPPVFDGSSRVINISLDENTPGGTQVLNVTARDSDEGSNAIVTYSIEGAEGQFYIDSNTGVLYTTPQTLDRETKDFFNLTITASDSRNHMDSITIIVNVLDINDNPPRFNSSVVSLTVNEGSSVMIDVTATDSDQGANQEIEYRIISGNDDGSFQINNKTGRLTSVTNIDRERLGLKLDENSNGIYSLVVEAADHGQPQLSSTANVVITVRDVNDNAPVFQQSMYTFETPENASVGNVVGSIKADDIDIGANGQVVYSIKSTGSVIPFAITTLTGILTVNKSLDREVDSSYEFAVQATDAGSPSLNSTATVKVVIKDINDNKPKFGQETYHVTIPENTPGGSEVLKLDARDSDEGSRGQVDYAIVDGGLGHFIIEEGSGIIRTLGNLDYEANQSYTLNVSASDGGSPSLRDSVLVFVNVTDINDNVPVFNQSEYSLNVSEGSPVAVLVQATDLDQGTNANVSYSLVNDFGTFTVNEDSGELSNTRQLNREERDSYQIQVKATDKGVPPLSSIALVRISVTDVNDNTPTFSKPSFNFHTSEDALNGAVLGLILAFDRDAGDNARLNYSITGGRKDLFQIDSQTGSLSLVRSAIGLANQNISLQVTCSDSGIPPLSSNVNVSVFISTGSKKVPKLVPRHLNVSVYENASTGDTIVKLNVSVAENIIEYVLLAGDHGKFALNSTNGVLSLIGGLDREKTASYMLYVKVQDRTFPLYSNYGTVFIDILDINDNQPTFIQELFGLCIPEDTSIGSKVARVKATDPDEGVNSEVFYSLQDDASSPFSIDNRTGDVFTKTGLDYETTKSYNLTVVAENTLSLVRMHSLITFTINIEDTLDYKPTFPSDWLNTSIAEDAPIGSFVIDVNATLNDKLSRYVFYRLLHNMSSVNSYHFMVEPESGIIQTQSPLDRETTSNYTLVVEARDLRGTNEYRAIAHVIVDILDVNDNDPVFLLQSYTFSPDETSLVGNVIGQIQARDADKDENAEVLYDISDGNQNGFFRINSSDGRIGVAKTLDFESQSTFTLEVRAYDKLKGRPARQKRDVSSPTSSQATVTVQVQDKNDNPPVFTQQVYLGRFYPETSESVVVSTVKAIDNDSGTNSIVRYYATNESLAGVLSLNSITGHVMHNKSFLNERTTSFLMRVYARDNNGMIPYNTASNPATVMVFYLTPSASVTLTIGVPLRFVTANRQELKNLLRNITGKTVFLKSLQESPDDPSQTISVVHLVNTTSMTVINRDQAIKIFSDKSGELETRHPEWKIKVLAVDSPNTAASRRKAYFSFYIAAMMAFAILIGIVGLIGLIVVCRYKKREKKFSHDIAVKGTDTDLYSINIPGIGAYIESRADHIGMAVNDNEVQGANSNHQNSNNEETDSSVARGPTNAIVSHTPLEEESMLAPHGSQIASQGNTRNTLNVNESNSTKIFVAPKMDDKSEGQGSIHLMDDLENEKFVGKDFVCEANGDGVEIKDAQSKTPNPEATGAFSNNAYEEHEDEVPNNMNNRSRTPNEASIEALSNTPYEESEDGTTQSDNPSSIPKIAFVSRNPFTRSKMYLPNMNDGPDNLITAGSYGALNGISPMMRSDSYSPADNHTKNNIVLAKNEKTRGFNFSGRSSRSIAGVYDIQKRRELTKKKKRKRSRSPHVRFDLGDSQHPDELEWERQVSGNRNIQRDPLDFASDDCWSDADEPVVFHTFVRKKKNESKTDDSPDSSISGGDECEVMSLEDVLDGAEYPSDDEKTKTYVINAEMKSLDEAPLETQL